MRRSNRLVKTTLPVLLRKPASRWTKEELWEAIWLHFHRPRRGMILAAALQEMEARLRGESTEVSFPRLTKKGRRPRFGREKYASFLMRTEEIRQQIAREIGAPWKPVTDKKVARRLAQNFFYHKGQVDVPEYRLAEKALEYEIFTKGLKKKKKLGEI